MAQKNGKKPSHFLMGQSYLKYEVPAENDQDFRPFSLCFSSRLIMVVKKRLDKAELSSQKTTI